jgi:hypothetical protein
MNSGEAGDLEPLKHRLLLKKGDFRCPNSRYQTVPSFVVETAGKFRKLSGFFAENLA